MSKSLVRRFDGPFQVLEWIGDVAYKLELSFHLRAHHPIFHINPLNKGRMDTKDLNRVEPPHPKPLIVDHS